MNEASWKRLLGQIREGSFVPVIGTRLLVGADGQSSLQAQVAERLLASSGLNKDETALPPFRELNEAVSRLKANGAKMQDLYWDVHQAIQDVTGGADVVVPAPVRQLAEITDFRLYVTLTPDNLLARSLRQRCAVTEIVNSTNQGTADAKDLPRDWAERQGEVHVLYLFGKSSASAMFAIHDEDVLEHAHNVIAGVSPVRTFLATLQQHNLLLIGCNFPEWLSRFFLRATRRTRLSTEQRKWLIEPLQPEDGLTRFISSFCSDTEVLSNLSPVEFVAELHRRWVAERGAAGPKPDTPDSETVPLSTMFFISYSRKTDLPRAESLFQSLLALGVGENEIWFDRKSIEPGQSFRQRILGGIRQCRYFLPLLSEAANEREEGFVFTEWQEANLRNQGINREFLIPVIVDPTYEPERYTARPVQEGQWATNLDFGYAPGGQPDVRTTSKLKKLVRGARLKP